MYRCRSPPPAVWPFVQARVMGDCISIVLGVEPERPPRPEAVYSVAAGTAKCEQAVIRMALRSQKAEANILALEARIRTLLEEEEPDEKTIRIEAANIVRAENLCLAHTQLIYYCKLVGTNCRHLATGGYVFHASTPLLCLT